LETIDSSKPYVEKNQVRGTLIEQLETLFAEDTDAVSYPSSVSIDDSASRMPCSSSTMRMD